MGRFLKTHKPHIIGKTVELVGVKSDGTEFPIELSLSVTNDEQGILFAGVIRDITDRKKTERGLANNQKKLEQAQRIAGIGLIDWQIKSNKMELSDEALTIFGIEREQEFIAPDSLSKTVYPPDIEYVQKNMEQALRGEKEYNIDHRVAKSDGAIIWVHAQAKLILDPEGKPEALLGTVIDITERRQNAEKVKIERDKAQQYLDITGAAIVVIGRDQKLKTINKKGCQILGYEESGIIGKNWINLVTPAKQRAAVKTSFDALMNEQREPFARYESTIKNKNKETRILVDSSAECICQLDTKVNFLYMNPTGLESHEITSIDDLQKLCCYDLAEPAYNKVLKDTLKAARTGEIQRFEYESETVDGVRWFESIMAPITDESGKIVSFIRLSGDITDRKQKEAGRRENEGQLGLYRSLPA